MPANIVVPEVGESIVDARVAKWLRQEGDVVAAGDPLVFYRGTYRRLGGPVATR